MFQYNKNERMAVRFASLATSQTCVSFDSCSPADLSLKMCLWQCVTHKPNIVSVCCCLLFSYFSMACMFPVWQHYVWDTNSFQIGVPRKNVASSYIRKIKKDSVCFLLGVFLRPTFGLCYHFPKLHCIIPGITWSAMKRSNQGVTKADSCCHLKFPP